MKIQSLIEANTLECLKLCSTQKARKIKLAHVDEDTLNTSVIIRKIIVIE